MCSDSAQRRRVEHLGLDRILPHHGGQGDQNALQALAGTLHEVVLRVDQLLVELLLIEHHLVLLSRLVGHSLLQLG